MSRFNPALYEKTPMVSVLDNRGLHVRDIGYHRAEVNNATDTRITRHQYNTQGYLSQSLDPRLYASQQNDSTIKPNFIWQYDLNGQILHTDSVDAGRTVTLNDIEGRPIITITATEVTQKWQYEAPSLPGRLLSVSEQAVNVSPRITERLFWSDNSQQAKDNNLVGQCIKHYDPAGLNQLQSGSLTGAILKQSRQFILNDQKANWTDNNLGALDNTLHTTQSTVDATSALLTQTDTKGNLQRLAYNIAGQLKGSWLTLKDQNEKIILKSLTYSAAGQKLQEVHGNGVITDYTYEPETQRLISITTHRPSDAKVLQDLRYDYDPVGNVLNIRNDTEATRFWRNQKVVPENSYSYDSLYQLINATGREMANLGQQSNKLPPPVSPIDSSTYTNYTRSYSYDNAGNLLQIRHSSPATNNNYTLNVTVSNRSNHAVSQDLAEKPEQVDVQFDAGGHQMNLIQGQSLNWNSRGELQQVNKVSSNDSLEEYRYDSSGKRMLKIGEQQRVTYLTGLELRTTKNGNSITEDLQMISVGEAGRAQVRVLHWESGKPADIDNNQLRYSYDNLLSSSQLELDGTGQIITEEEYYPYGGTSVWATRNQTEAHYKTIRYSGKERDATGLYYYGFRYYQPWVGRWLSADPAGTIDGLNLYRMVKNNPITFKDDKGLAPEPPQETETQLLIHEFKEGDILYGLDNPRATALADLAKVGFKRTSKSTANSGNVFSRLRQSFRKKNNTKRNILIQNDITNATWDASKPREYATDKSIKKEVHDYQRVIGFREFLSEHPKYNVKNDNELVTALINNPSITTSVPLWQKTSKAGLDYQLFERKAPVPFLVDTIGNDINTVISKQGHGASITSSELRWLYRHKDTKEVKENLKFWRDGKAVPHSEVFSEAKWSSYQPKHRYS
ncbi:RHS repeat-associated core domain-containing protein [Xenorhabdus bovienii]|uniref:RHS repeat-associated core domain-containing protein n=1 Tax=Xenorhabdus bovienii TaxID=40576 RepID=UPI0023B30198|nr:RHS repeat-associated core domain-containing protein [Xenorhabdus bovienii]MDE9535686.1 toxin [Xenorhabdus bovienii]MDE9588387.1 toxin [Xenorhabdus bovienii]